MKKSLLLSIFMLAGALAAPGAALAAECPINPYMNTPEKIYFDDNFEDRETGAAVTGGTDEFAVTSLASSVIAEENGGKFCHTEAAWQRMRMIKENAGQSDTMTFSFDLKYETGGTGGNLYIGGDASETRTFYIQSDAANQIMLNYYDASGAGKKVISGEIPEDGWNRIAITMHRVSAPDGGWEVYPEKIVLNGKAEIFEGLNKAHAAVVWWDKMHIGLGNFSKPGVGIDNVMIYEPKPYAAERIEYDSAANAALAELTAGADTAQAEAVLITPEGEKACSVTAAEDSKRVEIALPIQPDLENQSYYLVIKALPSLCGEQLQSVTIPLYKSLAAPIDETTVSVALTEGGVSAAAFIEPLPGKTVYMAAGAWRGNKLLGFKIIPCSEPKEYTALIETDTEAELVQLFLIDGTETGGLVSKVYTLNCE